MINSYGFMRKPVKSEYFIAGENKFDDGNAPTAIITDDTNYGYNSLDVPLEDVETALKTDVKFKMATITYMAFSVGMGHWFSAAKNEIGAKAKDLAERFDTLWNMDEINQICGRDGWSSGNFFLNVVPANESGHGIGGLYNAPNGSFQGVVYDDKSNIIRYVQQLGSQRKEVPAGDIEHMAWLPFGGEWAGEGIGQILLRSGSGYKTQSGKTVARKPWLTINEMVDDVVPKMIYAGQPRYFITFDGATNPKADSNYVRKVRNAVNKMDPLQSFVGNVKGEAKTIALDTQNRFGEFMRKIDDNILTGTMSPLIRLWSSMDFTYASSKEAVSAMQPLIGMYQRAHKRFMELRIYRRVLEFHHIPWKDAGLEINWGQVDPPTLEEIQTSFNILQNPKFDGLWDPKKMIDMIETATGMDLSIEVKEMAVKKLTPLATIQNKLSEHRKPTINIMKDFTPNEREALNINEDRFKSLYRKYLTQQELQELKI